MAILQDGPNGGFRGKVGSVYGYYLNGKCIIRGARRKSTKPPTAAQLLHRRKTKLSSEFCALIKPVITFGYQFEAAKHPKCGAFQLAQKTVFNEVLSVDVDNNPFIRLENLRVFVGDLMPPADARAYLEGDSVKLSWTPNPQYKDSIYKVNLAWVSLDDHGDLEMAVADAAQGECTVKIPALTNSHRNYHIYIGFWDTFHGAFSDSAYCGPIL